MLFIFFSNDLPSQVKNFSINTIKKLYSIDITHEEFNIKDLEFAYNAFRDQYNAGAILEWFARKKTGFLVIIKEDIYVDNLNFVFGVAYPNLGVVISTFRLSLEADEELFYSRLQKTIKHELGHFFGLRHCKEHCVMRFSNSLYELDIKASEYCNRCRSYLKFKGILKEA